MTQLMTQQGLAGDTTDRVPVALTVEVYRVDIRGIQIQTVGEVVRVDRGGPIVAV